MSDGARTEPTSPLTALFARVWGPTLSALADPLDATALDLDPDATAEAQAPDVLARLGEELAKWLWSRNQFLALDDAAHVELAALLRRALDGLERGDREALSRHRRDLYDFVRARLGPSPREVVAAEYAPDLQLSVLGIALDAESGPVLDVGCGSEAALVRALGARGIEAHGIDRSAPSDVATRADWLRFDYGRDRYRTVISHHGFSLHFLQQHLAGSDGAYDYARAYMAILRSLAPSGRFVYTPPLAFFESLLDPRLYRVRSVPLPPELRPRVLSELERETGLSLASATHVERIG